MRNLGIVGKEKSTKHSLFIIQTLIDSDLPAVTPGTQLHATLRIK